MAIDPGYAEARSNLGASLAMQGKEAIAHYRNALKIDRDGVMAHATLALLLATGPEAALRNGGEAVEHAERLVRLCGATRPEVLTVLADAYAEARRFPEALTTARQALELAEQQDSCARADALRQRIALYERGMPFHQTSPAAAPSQPKP